TGGTFVASGAAVKLTNNVTVAENFVIRDVGVGLDFNTMGAIRSTSGSNTLSGVISLVNNGSFGVDNGSTLTVTGTIGMVPSSGLGAESGFTKFGSGTLVLQGNTTNPITGPVDVLQGKMQLNMSGGARAFSGPLVIGDNRDGVVAPEAPVVQLLSSNQLP